MQDDEAGDGALLRFALHDADALLLGLGLDLACEDDGAAPQSPLDALFLEQLQPIAADHVRADAMPPLASADEDAGPLTTAGAKVQSRRKAQTKMSRQRQKEELVYLRAKVAQMEVELSYLEAAKNGGNAHNGAGAESSSAADLSSQDAGWKALAQRQQKDAVRAQRENAQLKTQVEEQLRFTKSLQRMLRKRKIWDKLEKEKRHRAIGISDKESDIFDALSRSVDLSATRLDQELEAHGREGESSSANVAYTAEEGLHVNFVETIVLPFELRVIADLSWKMTATTDMKVQNLVLRHEIVEKTDSKLVCKAVAATKDYDAQSAAVYSVFKRTVEENQVAVVFESLMKSRGFPWSGNAGIHLVQKGWIKMTHARDESLGTTHIHSYARTTPTMTGRQFSRSTGTLSQFHDAGMLTEAIISSHQHNALAARQSIENELLDAFLKPKENV